MSFDKRLTKKVSITVVDRIVCIMRRADEKLRVKDVFLAMLDVIRRHRIHMMDDDPIIDLITRNPEVQTLVSSDNMVTKVSPLSRSVKSLIEVSIVAECRLPDLSPKAKVVVSILECRKTPKFRI